MAEEKDLQLTDADSALREARRFIIELASVVDGEFRSSLELAIIEFVENLVKYAAPSSFGVWANVKVQVSADEVTVSVASRPEHAEDRRHAVDVISKINASDDVAELYKARLMELFKSPNERPRLGLLRVAYEGGFKLSVRQSGPMMEIIASKGRISRARRSHRVER